MSAPELHIAEVVFNLPISHGFDYEIPEHARGRLQPGMRVVCPFGHRRLIGMVVALRSKSAIKSPRMLSRVLDPRPMLDEEGFRLAAWLVEAYYCSFGEACAAMVPSGLRLRGIPEEAHGASSLPVVPEFTAQQRVAFEALRGAIESHRHAAFLLHGVTGSGKTELYLRTIARALEQGRSAVVLVPEIAITPQTTDRFRERFGDEVVVWHSRLTARQRAARWERLLTGRSRIVVGTRSAVFAPVQRLGVVVLDEEHDPSYKQDQSPRYHARDVALARARLAQAIVILGSATPSVESYYAATTGPLRLLELTERVQGRPLPQVEIVDMRKEFGGRRRVSLLSTRLSRALQRVVEAKEQAILLLNRRGFSRVAQCPACGSAMRCQDCTVPLVYHASRRELVCHYCNRREPIPEMCPVCHKGYLRLRGAGTERVESELHRLFPGSGIARMDTDSMKAATSHRELYDSMRTQLIDLLVGTQMVAKGLDIPQVTLVGVVSADTALNLPDFRAGERTFDLLTQVAGRAGRGDRPGHVVVQTYCPTHYAIRAASRHDYAAFYREEIEMRKRLGLPPFVHLVELTIQDRSRHRVQAAAEALRAALVRVIGRRRIGILGPAPHRIAAVRGIFRWHLVLKARQIDPLVKIISETLGEGRRFHGLPVIVDVDPLL